MKNLEIAKIFYNMSAYLEMTDIKFKPEAYERAARAIETMPQDIEEVKLENIPGVGRHIADKIQEYLKTGKIKAYQKLKKQIPVKIEELVAVEGIGPKRVKILYKSLGIRNIKDLEKNAKAGKIAKLENFGEKTERNILKGIEFVKASQGRILLGQALPIAESIKQKLFKYCQKISIAGSLRRMQETIGDIDLLAAAEQSAIEHFVKMPGIKKIWAQGPTKASVRLNAGFDVDLRIIKPASWGSALQYFTGSKEHNISLRRIAISKGCKLNEYGLFKNNKKIAGKTEQEIYNKLGLDFIPPEIRQNTGELENKLPDLIDYQDIKGDLQIHTDWSDGTASLAAIIIAAEKLGYKYIAITDHAGYLSRVQNGLDKNRLFKQMREIDKLKTKLKILKGAEVNITEDGKIDMKDEILAKLDWVIAGVHSHMKMGKKAMTQRIIRAMQNPNINMIAHPTGRLINKRPAYELDLEAIFKAAKNTNTYLEINSSMDRLDLNCEIARKAIKFGLKLVINTDSHSVFGLSQMHLGIAQARRAWAEKKDILNTKHELKIS
ncbi:MAG: DNA polymerase/3'-5' exonuclease PolX [bacterium]